MKKFTTLVVALLLVSGNALAQTASYGNFTYVERIDVFDDTDRSYVAAFANEEDDRDAAILWRCMSDGLNVVYHFDKYYGGDADDDILVRYRMDSKPASDQQYWRLMSENTSAHIRMYRVDEFTRQALNAQVIRFEAIDPVDDERLVNSFDVNGLAAALNRLSCYQ